MITNEITLTFWDCQAVMNIKTDVHNDCIALSITELEFDKNKSSENHDVYKESSTTEIYLGNDELKRVIKSLESLVVEDDEA